MRASVKIQLEGTEGIFTVEKKVSLFLTHTTKETLKDTLQGLKKEVAKFVKNNTTCTITLLSMDATCHSTDVVRMFPSSSDWRGEFVLDYREVTRFNDYSDSKEFHFMDERALIKATMKKIADHITQIMGELPENQSYYSQNLDEIAIPEEIMPYIHS
jgi:hypothetical protein